MTCNEKYARIHNAPGYSWCPERNVSGEYLQIDLGVESNITAIQTQGKADGKHWTRYYYLQYSDDATNWTYYNNKQKLLANRDSNSIFTNFLKTAITTRFLRIKIADWHSFPALRVELLGCQKCNSIINYEPRTIYQASSIRSWFREKGCDASEAFIDGNNGWCSKWNNIYQWISVDIGPPTKIVGVVTRGRGSVKSQWVTSYKISYSNDSIKWHFIKDDENNITSIKEFGGNMDSSTKRWHYFTKPFVARYIRFNPLSWKNRIGMRIGIIGCLHQGPCPEGFVQINNYSECCKLVTK